MANDSSGFTKAAKAKKVEFYTQLTGIEEEMRHYRAFLKVKLFFVIAMTRLKAFF